MYHKASIAHEGVEARRTSEPPFRANVDISELAHDASVLRTLVRRSATAPMGITLHYKALYINRPHASCFAMRATLEAMLYPLSYVRVLAREGAAR